METSKTIDLAERVAVLETKLETLSSDLGEIKTKLDSLLELKTKGMGAIGLVGIIISSGFIGLVMMAVNFFKPGHL